MASLSHCPGIQLKCLWQKVHFTPDYIQIFPWQHVHITLPLSQIFSWHGLYCRVLKMIFKEDFDINTDLCSLCFSPCIPEYTYSCTFPLAPSLGEWDVPRDKGCSCDGKEGKEMRHFSCSGFFFLYFFTIFSMVTSWVRGRVFSVGFCALLLLISFHRYISH